MNKDNFLPALFWLMVIFGAMLAIDIIVSSGILN